MTAHGAEDLERDASSETSDARLEAAAALRKLGNAFVAHQVDDEILTEITARIEALTPAMEQEPARTHAFLTHGADLFASRLRGDASVAQQSVFPDCVVSGLANPMGLEARLWMEGEESVMAVTLGAAFEGAPGRAHGGVVAALMDETMGLVMSIAGTPAFTGKLSITYRAPTPVGVPLTARARLSQRKGRKLTITSELRSDTALLAEAEGLFIAVDASHFLGEN